MLSTNCQRNGLLWEQHIVKGPDKAEFILLKIKYVHMFERRRKIPTTICFSNGQDYKMAQGKTPSNMNVNIFGDKQVKQVVHRQKRKVVTRNNK